MKASVQVLKCLDPVRAEGLHRCWDEHIIMTDYILNNVTFIDQFSARCCSFHHLVQCVERFSDEVGKTRPNRILIIVVLFLQICFTVSGYESRYYFTNILKRLFTSFFPCSEKFSDLTTCEINMPNVARKFDEIAHNPNTPKQDNVSLWLQLIKFVQWR